MRALARWVVRIGVAVAAAGVWSQIDKGAPGLAAGALACLAAVCFFAGYGVEAWCERNSR